METDTVLQFGALATGVLGFIVLFFQLRTSIQAKQGDNFLILSERYILTKQDFYDAIASANDIDHKSIDEMLKEKTLDELNDDDRRIYKAARSLISLYRTEFYLVKFGGISKQHWNLWHISFEEDSETRFWPDFWSQVRERYVRKVKFVKFMDKLWSNQSNQFYKDNSDL